MSAIRLLTTVLTTFPSLKDLAVLLSWIRSRAQTYCPSRFSSLDVSKTSFAETRYFSDDDYLDKVTSFLREKRDSEYLLKGRRNQNDFT